MNIRGFEDRLVNARKDNNYTQEDLAMRLGVTPQAVSKWERGMGYPDIELMVSLCNVLHCSLDYLLNGEKRYGDFSEDSDVTAAKEVLKDSIAEPLLLEIGIGLVAAAVEENRSGFSTIEEIRKKAASALGILIPQIRIRDSEKIDKLSYRFFSYGSLLYENTFSKEEEITFQRVYEDLEAVCTKYYGRIINKQVTRRIADNLADRYPEVINGVVPEKISLIQFQNILIHIYNGTGSLHNLIKIVELLDEKADLIRDIKTLSDEIIKNLKIE